MTQFLKNIKISEISFVPAGANGAEFIAKSADGTMLVEIRKADAVKKAVYGIVYEPDKEDSQGEKATAGEIEKAAWGALQNHAVIKTDHKEPASAYLAESYLAKANDPDGYPEGAWAVVVKVEDDALFEQIEKGECKAFSMGGQAEKVPMEKEISGDSMVYASNLKDALKLLQAVAQTMGDTVEKMGEIAKTTAGGQADLTEKVEKAESEIAAMRVTVQKIADQTTDGRVTSAEPGTPTADPSRY